MLSSTVPLSPTSEAASGGGTWGQTIPPDPLMIFACSFLRPWGCSGGNPPGGRDPHGTKPPSRPPARAPCKAPGGGARYRHHLAQPARRRRRLRHSAGCWQGNLLAWMANVRVTYRNRHAAFCFVCQPVHRHGREGGGSTGQAVRPQKSHRAAQTGAGNTRLSCCRDIP